MRKRKRTPSRPSRSIVAVPEPTIAHPEGDDSAAVTFLAEGHLIHISTRRDGAVTVVTDGLRRSGHAIRMLADGSVVAVNTD